MQLQHGAHLGYCTNIHRGESWAEVFHYLKTDTLRVKQRVAPQDRFGIGLRLSAQAAAELSTAHHLTEFRQWLDQENGYVFTINGFPYGSFHGTRVKEKVFQPDWTQSSRLEYTLQLFELLAVLTPSGQSGSVSTLPASHKTFGIDRQGLDQIFKNLQICSHLIEALSEQYGVDLHLGLEPEPLGLFETTGETLKFFALYMDEYPQHRHFFKTIGVNYDTCHLALQYEQAHTSLSRLLDSGIRISKIHLSNALKVKPTRESLEHLKLYDEPVYFHQVIAYDGEHLPLKRYLDLPQALSQATLVETEAELGQEWRIHFHIPLHAQPQAPFANTQDHVCDTIDWLVQHPLACSHLEMETYTWAVLPEVLKKTDVVDQLEAEYQWTLAQLQQKNFNPM
jgi:hypothetical protein